MNFNFTGYIIFSLCVIAVVVVFYVVKGQIKARKEVTKKKETAIQLHKLRDSNDLIAGAKRLPFSKALFICLYQRQLLALTALHELEPDNAKIDSKIEYVKGKLKNIESHTSFAGNNRFEVPKHEMDAIELLKVLKRLRVVIRIGHDKGLINDHSFIYENTRLESYQIRITIENLMKRIDYALKNEQMVMAKELLKKGLQYLNSRAGTHPIDTVVELVEELKEIEKSLAEES